MADPPPATGARRRYDPVDRIAFRITLGERGPQAFDEFTVAEVDRCVRSIDHHHDLTLHAGRRPHSQLGEGPAPQLFMKFGELARNHSPTLGPARLAKRGECRCHPIGRLVEDRRARLDCDRRELGRALLAFAGEKALEHEPA